MQYIYSLYSFSYFYHSFTQFTHSFLNTITTLIYFITGNNDPVTVDNENDYTDNLSGLKYVAGKDGNPAALYGIMNKPSNLFRLVLETSSGKWIQDPTFTQSGLC